jgi:hypothetical protein
MGLGCHLMIDSLLKTVHHVSEQVSTMLQGHTPQRGRDL